jgi:hypothetical protein
MSIGAVGNVIYVNQQTASVAPLQGNQNTRFDLQNLAAQAAVNERDEKVLEVRPAEENKEVDSDREHQKEEADQETARSKKRDSDKAEDKADEEETAAYSHHLDIKV